MSERNRLGLPSMTLSASVGEASGVDQGRFCADLDGLPQNIDRVLSRNRNEDRVDRSTDICESAVAPDSVVFRSNEDLPDRSRPRTPPVVG